MPEFVGNSQSSSPVVASKACNIRSFVPPLNTSPPAVASIEPQLGDFAYLCVHTFCPVSTFHACTSPKWSAPGTVKGWLPVTPTKPLPGVYCTFAPVFELHILLLAG